MAKEFTILNAFVASPGDLQDERIALDTIVDEVNSLLGGQVGIRIELVKWETDVRPGVGTDGQDVVNRQIGDEYDIFIGILWQRFGTATLRAESGTVEEFDRALERYAKDSRGLRILTYFKSAPINPVSSDLEQAQKVQNFRRTLEARGVLWKAFDSLDVFKSTLRQHLADEVREYGKSWGAKRNTGAAPTPAERPEPNDEKLAIEESEPGFLDLLVDSMEASSIGQERLDGFMKRQTRFTKQINDATVRMGKLDMSTRAGVIGGRNLFEKVAAAMLQYARDLDQDIPAVADAAIAVAESISKAVVLAGPELLGSEQSSKLRSQMSSLQVSVQVARTGLSSMRGVVPSQVKKMSGAIATATRSLDAALARADQSLERVSSLVQSASTAMDPGSPKIG